MPRSKSSQSKHDREVEKIAKAYERKGFKVKADLPGYEKPGTIGSYRPDVVAKKGHLRKIVQVETPDLVGYARDQQQQRAFRNAAKRSVRTAFQRKVTK